MLVVIFGTMAVGNNAYFFPDVYASKKAAINLFQIIDS